MFSARLLSGVLLLLVSGLLRAPVRNNFLLASVGVAGEEIGRGPSDPRSHHRHKILLLVTDVAPYRDSWREGGVTGSGGRWMEGVRKGLCE